jgi:hypothetical protein
MAAGRMIVMMTSWRAYWLPICIAGGLVYVGSHVYERLISEGWDLGNGSGFFVGGGGAWDSACG